MATMTTPYPIVDAHISLLDRDSSSTSSKPSAIPKSSFAQAISAIATLPDIGNRLEGYIAVGDARAANAAGHEHEKCVAVVVPLNVADGREALEAGLAKATSARSAASLSAPPSAAASDPDRSSTDNTERRGIIHGVHYAIRREARGALVTAQSIDALRWMGEKGLVLDLDIGHKVNGRWALDEAVEAVAKAHEGVSEEGKKVVVVLGSRADMTRQKDHMAAPDLAIYNPNDAAFVAWRTAIFTLSRCGRTYVKLSACPSQLPERLKGAPIDDIVMALQPYLAVLLASFGAKRLMFASAWSMDGEDVEAGRVRWVRVVERFCDLAGLGHEEQIMLWSGTTIEAYGIRALM